MSNFYEKKYAEILVDFYNLENFSKLTRKTKVKREKETKTFRFHASCVIN